MRNENLDLLRGGGDFVNDNWSFPITAFINKLDFQFSYAPIFLNKWFFI